MNMRSKIMGILSVLMLSLFVIAPVSAVSSSSDIGATSTVNEYLIFNVDKNALTYGFEEFNMYNEPNEGAVSMYVGGNFLGSAKVFAKRTTSSPIAFQNPLSGGSIATADSAITESLAEDSNVQAMFNAMASENTNPGVYNDVIRLTAMTGV